MNLRTDYSFLFSGMNSNTNNNMGFGNWLGDYASIKNGSYGKLLKAYYSEGKSDSVKSIAKNSNMATVTKQDAQKLNKVKTATDSLKDSADALLVSGSKSLFAQKDITTKDENGAEQTVKGYDTDAIYSAVNKFVDSYNSVINAVDSTENNNVINRGVNMANNTAANEKMLNKIGITVKSDGTLSLDKDTFMKADMKSVQSLFQGNGSFGYQTSAQASMINYTAGSEASKAATYTGTGAFSSTLNNGNIYNSFF